MNQQPDQFNDGLQEEKAHRIAALISGYIHKGLTPDEHDELDRWVGESEANMKLFEELTDDKVSQQALDWLADADSPRMLKKLKGKLTFVYESRPLFSQFWHYAVAASIALVLGTVGFFIYKNSVKTTAPVLAAEQPADVPPGREQATLTLADGRTIVLDEAKEGTIATQGSSNVLKQDGQLVYNNTGEKQLAQLINTVTTPRGGSYPLTLSDGTKLWLNAASSISFPAAFSSKERRVAITGEVYFEVAPLSPKGRQGRVPFIVEVKDKGMVVEVLGTHFNINSYDDESAIKTTLLEGAVKVSAAGKVSMMKPGQQVQLSKNNEMKTLNDADTDVVMAWKNGFFGFRNTDLKTAMRQVSRWYDLEVEFRTDVSAMGYSAMLSRKLSALSLVAAMEETFGGVHFKLEGKKMIVLP
jgi:transmembrane sensor